MKNVINTLAGLAALSGAVAPTVATTQTRYYVRERIVGLAANVPAYGKWSSGAWSAKTCSTSTGTQTRTVSCSTSSCDPATKPPTTQSAGSCSYSCTSLASDRYVPNGTGIVDLGSASTLAAANAACSSYTSSNKINGGCNWNNLSVSSEYRKLRFWVGATSLRTFGDADFYGSLCSWK